MRKGVSAVLATASPRRIKATHRRRRKVTAGHFVQRYYDPAIGRLLSVDPATVDTTTASNFNRYNYANNNPYRFTDPDGRNPLGILVGMVTEIGWQMGVEGKSWSDVDKSDVLVAGLIGAVAPGAGSAILRAGRAAPKIATSVKAIKALAGQSAKTANKAAKLEARVAAHTDKITTAATEVATTVVAAGGGAVAKNVIQDQANQQQQQQHDSASQRANAREIVPLPLPPPKID